VAYCAAQLTVHLLVVISGTDMQYILSMASGYIADYRDRGGPGGMSCATVRYGNHVSMRNRLKLLGGDPPRNADSGKEA
jgi:hypothetical protein